MRKYKRGKQKIKILQIILIVLVFFVLVLLGFFFLKLINLNKFLYVNNNGNTEIIIVDKGKKPIKIFIDKNFVVDSSRNLGEYKIGNLWILGEKKEYQGKLVAETVTKNFGIPVFLWKDGTSTNLNIFQKIKVFLTKKKSEEYDFTLTSKTVKDSILVNFVHPATINHLPKVRVDDLTGNRDVVNYLAKILEVMGFKIVDYSRGYNETLDCEVVGINFAYINIFRDLFDCQITVDEKQTVDLNIRVGKVFGDRF